MTGSRLLVGVASILGGTTVLLAVFGLVYNPILLLAAVPFALSAYFIWSHATGRLEARMRERVRYRSVDAGSSASSAFRDRTPRDTTRASTAGRRPPGSDRGSAPTAAAAARVLGVDPEADEATIRAAFREKAKAHHPDAPGGDEAAFRRAREAYERLVDRR